MSLTPEEFIKKHNLNNIVINSNEIPFGELPEIIVNDADKNNLVIVYGYSDDLCELRGAVVEEHDCYDGGKITVYGKPIKIIWHNDYSKYSWTYETDIPHACFDINEMNDTIYSYCQAIVFSLEKLDNTDNIPILLPCPICEGNVRVSFVDEDEKHAYSIIKCDYCKLSMKGNGYYLQSDNVAEARLQSLSILVNNWNDRRKKNNTSIKGEI